MLILPDSHSPCEDLPAIPSAELTSKTITENTAIEETTPEVALTETHSDTPADVDAPNSPPTTSVPTPPIETAAPWATVTRYFTQIDANVANAYAKFNLDFGLDLDLKTFTRLQDLFCNVLHREPTVGELFLLDQLDRLGCHRPHRRAMGELYTNSPAIAEAWADMMAKHGELYAAKGIRRDKPCALPPCTMEDSLSLIGRYLHRRGLVTPLTDGLPCGGKKCKGRTAVLATPAQEADAIAEGYALLKRLDLGNATRSLWVRKGPAMTVTPAAPGDFLICLPSPDPEVLAELLAKERNKKYPSIGAITALSHRSPMEAVLSLCDGADIYPHRLPRSFEEIQNGTSHLTHLCKPSAINPDTHPDYLLRVPAQRIKEWVETFRGAGMAGLPVGQVRAGDRIRIYLQQGHKDIPVAELSSKLLRIYPSVTMYSCQAEVDPQKEGDFPSPTVLDLPEMGLTMASATTTVTETGTGYTAAINAVSAAVSPLILRGCSTQDIRLSVSILAHGHEEKLDGPLTELVCGLYRSAAEGGMALEYPALIQVSPDEGRSPAIHLSVVSFCPVCGGRNTTT